MKPVRPGERGGRYHPFSDQDLEAIVENIYRILEEVGFKDATPHCIETCEAVGAILGEDGRLRMPRAVVDTALKHAKRNLILHAQDPEFDLDLSGSRVHFATAGAAWNFLIRPFRTRGNQRRTRGRKRIDRVVSGFERGGVWRGSGRRSRGAVDRGDQCSSERDRLARTRS